MPDLLPDGGPAPLPRERWSWRHVAQLLAHVFGVHPVSDEPDCPPVRWSTLPAGTELPELAVVRRDWPMVGRTVLTGLVHHSTDRHPQPARAEGLAPAVRPAVPPVASFAPTVPTAAGSRAAAAAPYPPFATGTRRAPGRDVLRRPARDWCPWAVLPPDIRRPAPAARHAGTPAAEHAGGVW